MPRRSGGGAIGPALTHISSQYPPAQLTALLKAPTAKMKAAGMVPLTLNDAEMKGLVSYLTSLGGTSAASAATPPASGSSSPAPAKAEPGAAAGASKAGTGSSAGNATAAQGKGIFDSQRCSGCHGASGGGGVGPALTHISSQYPPAQLTSLLKAPTAKMKAAGMVPLTLNAADMKALVSYVTSLGGTSAASAAAPPASGSASPAPAKAKATATAGALKTASAAAACFWRPHRLRQPKRNQVRQLDREEPDGKFDRRCNHHPGEEHFRFSRLQWMPRTERRWRRWASADSYFQSISTSSIDGTSESAQCGDESCRHGPTDSEWC